MQHSQTICQQMCCNMQGVPILVDSMAGVCSSGCGGGGGTVQGVKEVQQHTTAAACDTTQTRCNVVEVAKLIARHTAKHWQSPGEEGRADLLCQGHNYGLLWRRYGFGKRHCKATACIVRCLPTAGLSTAMKHVFKPAVGSP